MSVAAHQISTIQKSIVPGHLRASTLPQKFPAMFLVYESLVYRYMNVFASRCYGSYWEFVELSNGGFYMSLIVTRRLYLSIASSGFEGEMTADAASIVVNLFAQHQLAGQHKIESLIDKFNTLYEYAAIHPESQQILRATKSFC